MDRAVPGDKADSPEDRAETDKVTLIKRLYYIKSKIKQRGSFIKPRCFYLLYEGFAFIYLAIFRRYRYINIIP